jgi:hypothetical protein
LKKTLDFILNEYANNVFSILSIDAEGVDELIIKAINFEINYTNCYLYRNDNLSNTGNGIKINH